MILWDETADQFGVTELTAKTTDKVVVACDKCTGKASRTLATVRRSVKRRGYYHCHSCATGSQEFKDACSTRASAKWKDLAYRASNLATVTSEQYRDKKRSESLERWQDPEFRQRMTTPERTEQRRLISSLGARQLWQDPVYRTRLTKILSERQRLRWCDITYKQRMQRIQSQNTKRFWAIGAFDSVFGAAFAEQMKTVNRSTLARPAVRSALSIAGICNWGNPDYRQRVIAGLKRRWRMRSYRSQMAVIRATRPIVASQPQRLIYQYLDDLGVSYLKEGPGTTVGEFVFDCVVPRDGNKHLIIEHQGDYWHTKPNQMGLDREKFIVISRDYPEFELMYVWEHELYCKERVLDRLRTKLGLIVDCVDFRFDCVQLRPISGHDLRLFLDAYHYVGKGRGGVSFGAYLDAELIGCVVYSTPLRQDTANQFETPAKRIKELSRFCIHPRYQKKNFASWLIARALKLIDADLVIAYSDSTVGHSGTIYKASNFRLHHTIPADYWYVDSAGYMMHKLTLYKRAVVLSMTEREFATRYGYCKRWGGQKFCYTKSLV